MSLAQALERLRSAIDPKSLRSADGNRVTVQVRDLSTLLEDHARMDAHLRAAHVRQEPGAYPPHRDMLARIASDPGAYAGYKGERSMGRWIADAIVAVYGTPAATEREVKAMVVLERIAGMIGGSWEGPGPAQAVVDEIQRHVRPLIEGLGMTDEGDGYGFDWSAEQEAVEKGLGGRRVILAELKRKAKEDSR